MKLLCFLTVLVVGCRAFLAIRNVNVGPSVPVSTLELKANAGAATIVRPQSSSPRKFSLRESPKKIQEPLQEERWHRLYQRITGYDHNNLLSLQHNEHGYRGVYLNQSVNADDIVLKIPLSNCLRDDCPPSWLCIEEEMIHADHWATRLAACLLDRQRHEDHELWFGLLPDSSFLRASLPIHWSDNILRSAASTALELAVDASYFVRAAAVQDILRSNSENISQRRIEDALDIVQTRSCRVYLHDRLLRLLAPVFDFINHDHHPNCAFELLLDNQVHGDSEGHLVVRALHDIHSGQEITIDYGLASTRPAWKCLSSYGFVPSMKEVADEEVAEVYIDGRRFDVTPTTIPEDLVTAILEYEDDEIFENKSLSEFNPSVARKLASRVGKVAFCLLLNPWETSTPNITTTEGDNFSEENDDSNDDEEDDLSTAEEILSSQLAASLRFHQHRVLLACANGLEEWALANEESSSHA
jgi:hypothetical protein